MSETAGHGTTSPDFNPPFTVLLDAPGPAFDIPTLGRLALAMISPPDDPSDQPDPEENVFVPAGYTYFGQFVDHDLTLDLTSSLVKLDALHDPSNARTPRLDLDCLYGHGPGDQPYMYVWTDDPRAAPALYAGASLLIADQDLARAPVNDRALIGDKRNDENSLVNQIQQAMIRFHNTVVAQLAGQDPDLRGDDLFKQARNEVRWAYQRVIVDDFLPRIIQPDVLTENLTGEGWQAFLTRRGLGGDRGYRLYTPDKRGNLPREFVAAAYRFGHSQVRPNYRLNSRTDRVVTFDRERGPDQSLLGFGALDASHVIDDLLRFFPGPSNPDTRPGNRAAFRNDPDHLVGSGGRSDHDPGVRLQFAYKIDPSLADPLRHLPRAISGGAADGMAGLGTDTVAGVAVDNATFPSLALLNLLRGQRYQLPSGQALHDAAYGDDGPAVLDPKYLVVRITQDHGAGQPNTYYFLPLDDARIAGNSALLTATPLWFYVLAEAQVPIVDLWLNKRESLGLQDAPADAAGGQLSEEDLKGMHAYAGSPECQGAGTRLGPVGGLIVAEVFYGLLDSDPTSIFGDETYGPPVGWAPIWQRLGGGGGDPVATFGHLLQFTRLAQGVQFTGV